MTDLISRSAAMNSLSKVFGIPLDYDGNCNEMCDEAFAAIEALPAIDAVPVVHARWIDMQEDDATEGMWRCSSCKEDFYFDFCLPSDCNAFFCPNCGAKMDAKED